MATKGDFTQNLGKVYGIYTGGFIVFILIMAVLEQLGVGADTIGASDLSSGNVKIQSDAERMTSWKRPSVRADCINAGSEVACSTG